MKEWIQRAGLGASCDQGHFTFFDWEPPDAENWEVVWLGHGSFLLRWGEVRVLVDPVFKKWMGLARRRTPLPDMTRLKEATFALVTHGHMDHLDEGSLRATGVETVLLPERTETFLSKEYRKRCRTVRLGETLEVSGLRITVVPAKHGGWRYPWQKGYFACGYVIENGRRTIYVSGDTAYGTHFGEIGKRWRIDIALLPIGAYAPQWFLRSRHLNPEEAAQAAKELGAGFVVPFHFGTYRLSLEPFAEPMQRWERVAKELEIRWGLSCGLDD